MSQPGKIDLFVGELRNSGVPSRKDVPGADLTTFRIGGPVAVLVEPETAEQLSVVFSTARSFSLPVRILGAGSNVLCPSAGVEGVVLRLGRPLRDWADLGGGLFHAGGACSLMSLSREISSLGFSGLEFAGGIPGSIGGAVRMNAGAYGSHISAVLEKVEIWSEESGLVEKNISEMKFSYRQSSIGRHEIVLGITFRASSGDKAQIMSRRQELLEERSARQPLTMPSAGSVFKNPPGSLSAGALIEHCGLKGRRCGGARISELHANWIVNDTRKATDSEVKELITICRQEVARRYSVELDTELVIW